MPGKSVKQLSEPVLPCSQRSQQGLDKPGKHTKQIGLDELVAGKLPERILAALGENELTIVEMIQWEASQPDWRIVATKDSVDIEIRVRIPMKKLLAILGSLGGFLWVATRFLGPYLPILQSLLNGNRPVP